jgi:arylsulfatase A-like enzyme
MKMRSILAALAAATMLTMPALARTKAAAPAAPQRPNILLIVLDDVGYSDLGAYGSEIRTPALDALAAGGLRYTRFDTRAVCSASRAALLTGRNNQTVGMENLPSKKPAPDPTDRGTDRGELVSNAETLAQALAARGYATHALGKWHLAPDYDAPPKGPGTSWPLQRGFQSFYGFIGGWTDQYQPALVEGNAVLPKPNSPGYHLSEDLTDRAIAAFDARPAGTPAFVYLAFGAAHSPLQVPKRYIDAYAGLYEHGWDKLRAARFARQQQLGLVPASTRLPSRAADDPAWDSLDPVQKRVYTRFMATYAGFVTHTDAQIGRLIAHLRETGKLANTVVIVLSDNGPASEAPGNGGFRTPYYDRTPLAEMDAHLGELGGPTTQAQYQRPWAYLGATPYRRYKLWPYAGGIRTPLIVSWPGHVAEPGSLRQQRVDVIDLAPTLLEAAGTRFAASIGGQPQLPVAGRSIVATLRSKTAPGRATQFFALTGNRAIYSGKWEAVMVDPCSGDPAKGRWRLFDSIRDPAQAVDVAVRNPSVVARIKALWQREADRWIGDRPLSLPTAQMCKGWYHFDDDASPPTPE